MKTTNFPSMAQALTHTFDLMPIGKEFFGWQLKNMVARVYPPAKNMYPDTILRSLRGSRRWQFVAVDPLRSKYRKITPVFGRGIKNGLDLRKKVKGKQ